MKFRFRLMWRGERERERERERDYHIHEITVSAFERLWGGGQQCSLNRVQKEYVKFTHILFITDFDSLQPPPPQIMYVIDIVFTCDWFQAFLHFHSHPPMN